MRRLKAVAITLVVVLAALLGILLTKGSIQQTEGWNLVWERRLQDPTGCLAMSSNAEYVVCSSEAKAKIIALAKNGSMLWEADLQRVIPLGDVMPISVSNDGTGWTATPYG